jgi:hypothetical protein
MRKLLKEHYKHLLNEEIDYSSKVATVYHLTGHKTAQYDPNWARIRGKTQLDYEQEVDAKYGKKKKTKAASILQKVEKSAVAKHAGQYKDSKGQAYYIAQQISSSLFDLGSYFQSGSGAMYGKGLYTCYKLNPKIAQTYGNVILRFDVDISNFLIFNAEIAKGVYGERFRLQDQFYQILKNKGFDLEGYFRQEVGLEISESAEDSLYQFIEYLTSVSESQQFLSSNYSNEDSRTAGYAIESLQKFSVLFGGGFQIKLRDIIDGIIFSGNHDGPVCIIYHPETMKTYKLTGAGYFDGKGNPVIESDIGSLGGQRSFDLKDSFETASEIEAESAAEIAKERENKWKNVLVDYNSEGGSIFPRIEKIINDAINPLYNVLCVSGAQDIMSERFKSSPEINEYASNLKKMYDFVQIGTSILAEPFIDFVEAFGPGMEIVSQNEFESYCYILKQYHGQSSVPGGYPPKLADFESNRLKCQAHNEEDFNRLVEQHLDKIIKKFDSLFNDSILKDIEEVAKYLSGWGELDQISNKYVSCKGVDVRLNTKGDDSIINSILNSNRTLIDSIEAKLTSLFAHPDLQSEEAQARIEDLLKYHWITPDGKIHPEKIAENFDWYSDTLIMSGDIFYTFIDRGQDPSTGQLSSYKIDKEKCKPFFILSMYGAKKTFELEEEFCSLIKLMFKEGSKAMSIGTFLTEDFVKKEILQEKTDNLIACLEMEFFLDGRTKIEI